MRAPQDTLTDDAVARTSEIVVNPRNGDGAARAFTTRASLGRYRLLAELARGGMGTIYVAVATDPVSQRRKLYAIKGLKLSAGNDEMLRMFRFEARIASRVAHPNVVQTHEIGEGQGEPFLVMEYLEGQSLHRLVRTATGAGGLPLAIHLRILIDALAGLHHVHELRGETGGRLGVVHRDVTPHNLVVTYDGQTKLLDFGIAKACDCSIETSLGSLKGKIAYMAPEYIAGKGYDHRADVYSMGVMLWEAAVGARLWADLQDSEVLERAVRGDVPSARRANAGVPHDLERICARALAHDPEQRYASAADLGGAIADFAARNLPRVGGADVGQLASVLFADERAVLAAMLEGQLTVFEGDTERPFPVLGSMRPPMNTPARVFDTDLTAAASGLRAAQAERFEESVTGIIAAPAVPGAAPESASLASITSAASRPQEAPPILPVVRARRHGEKLVLACAGVLLVVLVAVLGLLAVLSARTT